MESQGERAQVRKLCDEIRISLPLSSYQGLLRVRSASLGKMPHLSGLVVTHCVADFFA